MRYSFVMVSITASMPSLQEEAQDDLAHLAQTSTRLTIDPTPDGEMWPNKYIYPEFAGLSGERLIKELLRQILSNALYRTWEVFDSKHAHGNVCYMSIESAANKAKRAPKTIRENLAELSANQLMVMHGERKAS